VGLVVTRVVAPGNSLLVVTSAGMPVGVAAVKPGVTDEVKIPLTGVMASSKITVMLYLDKGRAGVFDANIMNPTASPDRPVFVGGQQVVSHVSAWQAGQASQAGSATLDVFDQAETSGTVLITHVATPGPSWITVSADASGVPGAILGSRSLGATDTVDVKVPLNNTTYRGPVWVGLHVDAGTTGVLEYDRFGSFSSSPDQLYTVNDKELLLHVKLQ
jgi:hypothetical protein